MKKWNKENSHIEALKYKHRSDFQRKCSGAYHYCRKNKLLNDICSHMNKKNLLKWTKEKCQEEALKYNNKIIFRKKSSGAWSSAYKNKWLNDICSHMNKIELSFNYKIEFDICKIEALKYNVRTEFFKKSRNIWSIAYKNKWLNEICSHMIELKKPNGYWTKEKCQEKALKYKTKKDFKKEYNGAYDSASKNKWLNEICIHMKNSRIKWTKEKCQEEALKYKIKKDFIKNCRATYDAVSRNKWLNEICSHML